MFEDKIRATGNVEIEVYEDDELVETIKFENLVVKVGRNFIAQRMISTGPNSAPTAMSHMAIGTSGNATDDTNTALNTEIARVGLNGGTGLVDVNSNKVVYIGTFPAGVGTGRLREGGILNAASAGVMLARSTFPELNKLSNQTYVIRWTISIN